MTFVSQEVPRDLLVTKLKAITPNGVALLADESGGPAHVVGYWEPNPKGISPFACVDSAGALYDIYGDDGKVTPFHFVVGFWTRRDASPATAEDQLNTLALELVKVLRANFFKPKFTADPQSDFEEIDGVPYKFELHFIEVQR